MSVNECPSTFLEMTAVKPMGCAGCFLAYGSPIKHWSVAQYGVCITNVCDVPFTLVEKIIKHHSKPHTVNRANRVFINSSYEKLQDNSDIAAGTLVHPTAFMQTFGINAGYIAHIILMGMFLLSLRVMSCKVVHVRLNTFSERNVLHVWLRVNDAVFC